jgi:hypothetical protein
MRNDGLGVFFIRIVAVVNRGGVSLLCLGETCKFELRVFRFNRLVDVPKHLNYDLKRIESERVFFLGCDDVLVLALLELALRYFGQGVHRAHHDVLLGEVAVVVDEDLK